MRRQDIQKKLVQSPFKPFKLFLTDGASYEVRHPELLLLGRRSCVLGLADNPDQTFYDRAVDIDLFHIVRSEFSDFSSVSDDQEGGEDYLNGASDA